MTMYVPDKPDASPGIIVALHFCGGRPDASGSQGWFQSSADKYGFIVIAPKSVGNCWDASPGRTGEKAAIAKMVEYVITQKSADKARVFSAGASSGACMTETLLASYPDVFAAGSVLAGIPVGAWPSGDTTCSKCSAQNASDTSKVITKTDQEWGDIVRNAYSFSGTRPRVQLWHGTQDEYLNYKFLAEEVKQWTNVLGLSGSGTTGGGPTGWDRTSYSSSGTVMLEVNVGQGKVHDLTQYNLWSNVVTFFGLDKDVTAGTGGAGGAGGGSSSSVATGGSAIAGGGKSSTGGAPSAGGKSSTGGAGPAAGGTSSSSTPISTTGGAKTTTGGTSSSATAATGGTKTSSSSSVNTGGTSSSSSSSASNSGGTPNSTSVGTTGNGGSATSTTASSTTSNTASGGSSNGSSSVTTSTGNAPATGTSDPLPESDGCGCRVAGSNERPLGAAGLLLAALGMLVRRRRRSA